MNSGDHLTTSLKDRSGSVTFGEKDDVSEHGLDAVFTCMIKLKCVFYTSGSAKGKHDRYRPIPPTFLLRYSTVISGPHLEKNEENKDKGTSSHGTSRYTGLCEGLVRTKRISKNIVFIALNDGSVLHNLQVVTAPLQLSEATLQSITPGSSLCVEGIITASQGQAQRVKLRGDKFTVLGAAANYPLQPKKHSFEFLREIAHLLFRTNTFGAVFRIRHAISYAIHQFFH